MSVLETVFLDDDSNETEGNATIAKQETMVQGPPPVQKPTTLRTHRQKGSPTPTQKAIVKERVTEDIPPRPSWLRQNLRYIGLGMVAMAVLSIVFVSCVYPAYISLTDRWNCGENLICHYDVDVGHNGISHFIAEYWHNQAVVIELPQHHSEKAKTYILRMPSGDDAPRIVTLHAAYVNMHGKPGYPDLEVYVDGFELPAILYNTDTGFSEEQPS